MTRDFFPAAVFTVLMLSLWALAFTNDEAMAHVFHHNGRAWALVLHVAIVAMPPVIAVLPEGKERRLGWGVWSFALLLAGVGNVAGSLAHAATVPIQDVFGRGVSLSVATSAVAVLGGLIIVVMEGVVGYLWEASLRRILAHFTATRRDVPADASPVAAIVATHEPTVEIAAPATPVAPLPAPQPQVVNAVTVNVAPQMQQTSVAAQAATASAATFGDEDRAALEIIRRAIGGSDFATKDALEASPWGTTRTRQLLNDATEAGVLQKLDRGQWAFAAAHDAKEEL